MSTGRGPEKRGWNGHHYYDPDIREMDDKLPEDLKIVFRLVRDSDPDRWWSFALEHHKMEHADFAQAVDRFVRRLR